MEYCIKRGILINEAIRGDNQHSQYYYVDNCRTWLSVRRVLLKSGETGHDEFITQIITRIKFEMSGMEYTQCYWRSCHGSV